VRSTYSSFYLGAQRRQIPSSKDFVWTDKSGATTPVTFTNWYRGEPSNYRKREHCVEMYHRGYSNKWNDVNCNSNRYFVLEFTGGSKLTHFDEDTHNSWFLIMYVYQVCSTAPRVT
jgi:hypothetical protein